MCHTSYFILIFFAAPPPLVKTAFSNVNNGNNLVFWMVVLNFFFHVPIWKQKNFNWRRKHGPSVAGKDGSKMAGISPIKQYNC